MNENEVINNLVNAINDKVEFDNQNDYLNKIKVQSSINNALNFMRTNSKLNESILETNHIDVQKYLVKENKNAPLKNIMPTDFLNPQKNINTNLPATSITSPLYTTLPAISKNLPNTSFVAYKPPASTSFLQDNFANSSSAYSKPNISFNFNPYLASSTSNINIGNYTTPKY